MDNMLSKALREFTTGPLNQLIVNVGGRDGDAWEEELKKFLRKEPCWSAASLLEFVSTIVVPTSTCKFVAREEFVCDVSAAGVKISYLSKNFIEWFLDGRGKIEAPMAEQVLRYAKLRKPSFDSAIIAELGGEAKAETALREMFFLMKKQGHGQPGVLNNAYSNIFYVRDIAGALRAVRARWSSVGWSVDASSVENPYGWGGGRQVFSRNSVLGSSATAVVS